MSALIAIVIATLIGMLIVRRVGLAFLYGTGVIYFVMLGVKWSPIIIIAISALIAYLLGRRMSSPATPRISAALPDIATIYTIIAYAIYATIARVWQWDFWMIWGMKSATFFETRAIDWRFLQQWWNALSHPDYPLLLPLNYDFAALLGGAWDDRWLGLYSVAFGVAILLIVRELAVLETNPLAASTIAFAASAFALTGHVGMAEAPLIAFSAAAILFLRRGLLFDERDSFRHGAVLLGLAANCKNEGITLAVCVAIAIVIIDRRAIKHLIPTAILIAPWTILRLIYGLSSDLTTGSFIDRVIARADDAGTIFMLLAQHFQDRLLWLCIAAGIVIASTQLRKAERFVLLVTALQLAIFVLVYFGTPADVKVHISTSWPRLPRQLAIPILFIDLVMLARIIWPDTPRSIAEAT